MAYIPLQKSSMLTGVGDGKTIGGKGITCCKRVSGRVANTRSTSARMNMITASHMRNFIRSLREFIGLLYRCRFETLEKSLPLFVQILTNKNSLVVRTNVPHNKRACIPRFLTAIPAF
jgi:hypothetical protein